MYFVSKALLFLIFLKWTRAGVIGEGERKEKILPFLAVVTFPNLECTTAKDQKGVCYSKKQCRQKGGLVSEKQCAQGYGICCTFEEKCSADVDTLEITNNLTTIATPSSAKSCKINIPKQKGVCQIRLDFINFALGSTASYIDPPTTLPDPPPTPPFSGGRGDCVGDKLLISPTQNLPKGMTLCGDAAGQHLYLHYGAQDKITLDIGSLEKSSYEIKVTMIKCNSKDKAPEGCTQFYTDKTGPVKSFNYPYRQLNMQQYTVCVANADGALGINWSPCQNATGKSTSFFISGKQLGDSKKGPYECKRDYVLLPGTMDERYCGSNFGTMVQKSSVHPFLMYVNFDEEEIPVELTSSTLNPDTGCLPPFLCSIVPLMDPTKTCTEEPNMGACYPIMSIFDAEDNYNIGFCLEYTVGF